MQNLRIVWCNLMSFVSKRLQGLIKNRIFSDCELFQNLFIVQAAKILTSKGKGVLPQLSSEVAFDLEKWEIVKQRLAFSVYRLLAEMSKCTKKVKYQYCTLKEPLE